MRLDFFPLFFKNQLKKENEMMSRKAIGIVLGFIGIYLLVSQKQIISQENSILGMLMIFACMLRWGYGSLFAGG